MVPNVEKDDYHRGANGKTEDRLQWLGLKQALGWLCQTCITINPMVNWKAALS